MSGFIDLLGAIASSVSAILDSRQAALAKLEKHEVQQFKSLVQDLRDLRGTLNFIHFDGGHVLSTLKKIMDGKPLDLDDHTKFSTFEAEHQAVLKNLEATEALIDRTFIDSLTTPLTVTSTVDQEDLDDIFKLLKQKTDVREQVFRCLRRPVEACEDGDREAAKALVSEIEALNETVKPLRQRVGDLIQHYESL